MCYRYPCAWDTPCATPTRCAHPKPRHSQSSSPIPPSPPPLPSPSQLSQYLTACPPPPLLSGPRFGLLSACSSLRMRACLLDLTHPELLLHSSFWLSCAAHNLISRVAQFDSPSITMFLRAHSSIAVHQLHHPDASKFSLNIIIKPKSSAFERACVPVAARRG
jgi:hypothetical protein